MTVERLDELLSAERLADSDDVAVMIAESLHEAQGVVLADERANPAHHGMGTTAVVVHVATDRRVATVANLGDSRCYVMRRDELAQVTVDHVWTSPSGRSLTQAIGSSDGIEPELFEVTLESGDRLLLCTDGLTDMVDDPGIAEVLGTAETAQGAADGLVAAALDRGGQDNITVVVAFVD